MLEEILKVLNKWKDSPHLWIGKVNIVKMAILPKAIYSTDSVQLLSKFQKPFFVECKRIGNLKFIWNANDFSRNRNL